MLAPASSSRAKTCRVRGSGLTADLSAFAHAFRATLVGLARG